jgi:aryl carrier-like protein
MVRQWIAELCELNKTPDENLPLIDLGMDSVRLLSLLERLREYAIVIGFVELFEDASISTLEQFIAARQRR